MPATAEDMLSLRIARAWDAARGVRGFELVHPDGAPLPPFTPGAHVQVRVPNGAWRKYSLCNDPAERHRYEIAVKRDESGRKASVELIEHACEGDLLAVRAPENAFALVDTAAGYLFIAGGIGITPIMSMIRSFGELPPAPWKLVYLCRTPESTAFRAELAGGPYARNVQIHYDEGDPARSLDLWPLLERPGRAHIYCCGPRALMDAVRDMSGHWPHANVHFESFTEGGAALPTDTPFRVRLARDGRRFAVPVGQTILGVLREAGLALASSCESGSCGTCRTRLLEGEADHRDFVLMPEETAHSIMICVSRARSAHLVLDL